MTGFDPLDNVSSIKRGEEVANHTTVGRITKEICDYVEGMDLPDDALDARAIVMVDTSSEGSITGTEGYPDTPEGIAEMVEAMFTHAAALMKQLGLSIALIGEGDIKRMVVGGDN